jgi:CHAT domain-containing protein/tetratricopeptide (TPR) repeat protein
VRRGPLVVCLAVLASLAAPFAAAQTPAATSAIPAPRTLTPGVVVEAALEAQDEHLYRASLDPGRRWRLGVEQLDCDTELQAREETGGAELLADGPLIGVGRRTLLLPPSASGVWQVRVSAAEGSGSGSYRLAVHEVPDDRLQAAAAQSRAAETYRSDDADSKRRALPQYLAAAALWRALGDERELAFALHDAGNLARTTEDPATARPALEEAAELWRRLGEPALEADARNGLGLTLWDTGQPTAAREAFERALQASRDLDSRRLEMISRNNLCFLMHSQHSLEEARTCYEQAVPVLEETGQAAVLAVILNNLGGVYHQLGEPARSEEYLQRALELHRESGNRKGEADVLNNLAALHRAVGDYEQALLSYEAALQIVRELENRGKEGRLLNNLGYAYLALGETDLAGGYFRQALALRREVGDRRGEAATLSNLGQLLQQDGDLVAAEEHFRSSLATYRELGIRRSEGITLERLGSLLVERGDAAAALELLQQATTALTEVGDPRFLAQAQRSRAEALAALGRGDEAREAAAAAVPLARNTGDRVGEARALLILARLADAGGNLAAASEQGEAAVSVLESLRSSMVTPDLRATFLASYHQAYELLVDVDMRRQRVSEALEVAERASARALLDQVLESVGDLPREVDPELAAERRGLEGRLRILAAQRLGLDVEREPERAAELDAGVEDVLARLDGVEARIRRLSPQYADLTRPPLLDTAGMQRLLGTDTLLLRFALGQRRSYLWRVTAGDVEGYELPGRQRIEELARQAHRELRARGASPHPQLAELARVLLAPVAERLDRPRILLVADGALHYVPFAALPSPGGDGEPLVARHEVVSVPSMSVLAVERRILASRQPAPHTLAVLADPVFHAADGRLPAGTARTAKLRAGDFGRLRFSRREAEAIAGLVPPADRLLALDFDASRTTALSSDLASYRIVHFATHGVIDERHPELSALVLSRLDEDGHRVEGLLGLRDLYRLHLGADLVVLSGCRTALGREVTGEGLIGLTRGFLYAGVPRVIASLWQVDDRATAQLMSELYSALLSDGLSPAAALRRAQLTLRNDPRTRDPYFWASFVLQGDWGPAAVPPDGDGARLAHRFR